MNTDLRPLLRAAALAAVALLAAGCATSTAARQALMETRPVMEPTAEARTALQGRAFRVGQVTVDIDVPEPKALHVLPDAAYATMLKAKLEQAFAAVDDRTFGDKLPLTEGQQPAYTVDVVIKRMRFINWLEKWDIADGANLELRAIVCDESGRTLANWPFRIAGGTTPWHTIENPRDAHGDMIPGAAALVTVAFQGARNGKPTGYIGPMAVNVTRYHHQFGFATMTRTETEALTGLHLDAISLPSEAEMKAARDRDAISLDAQRPERLNLTAAVAR